MERLGQPATHPVEAPVVACLRRARVPPLSLVDQSVIDAQGGHRQTQIKGPQQPPVQIRTHYFSLINYHTKAGLVDLSLAAVMESQLVRFACLRAAGAPGNFCHLVSSRRSWRTLDLEPRERPIHGSIAF